MIQAFRRQGYYFIDSDSYDYNAYNLLQYIPSIYTSVSR